MNIFNTIEYEDDHFSDSEFVFLDPSRQIQSNLSNILQLCDWDISELKEILGVSKSTCNNILGNDSMTNTKPTPLHKTDLITLLMCIQNKKVRDNKYLLVFYLYSILCPGMPVNLDFEPYKNLSLLENKLTTELLFQNLECLLPNITRDFNRFMDWRCNKPEMTITEYYGHPELNEYVSIEFDNNEPIEAEIKKAIKYTKKFIPIYLDWYISKITAWCR